MMIRSNPPSTPRAVRVWLFCVAALIFVTLIVGGATRLTESGLSITEWKPVTGIVPPLATAAWQAEFEKYRATPQYRELNRGMSLEQFKTIYWWEYAHRALARLVGAAFLLPLLWFLWRGDIPPPLRNRLWGIFAAGAVLGAVGWWMVASGLADRTSVSQYRLAFHLTLACAIYAAIIWTARRLMPGPEDETAPRLQRSAVALMMLVLCQIYLGALVAGLDAGMTFNTWPLIDGAVIPAAERLWFETPLWRNFFENSLTVQFTHRMTAYAIWVLAVLHAFDAWRSALDHVRKYALGLAIVVTAQAALGIVTLMSVSPLPLALAHQALAVIVLTTAVVHAARVVPQHHGAAIPVGAHTR